EISHQVATRSRKRATPRIPDTVGRGGALARNDLVLRVHCCEDDLLDAATTHAASTAGFFAASSCSLTGALSSRREIMTESISTWAISSVPMSRSMSLYFSGPREFHPWNR